MKKRISLHSIFCAKCIWRWFSHNNKRHSTFKHIDATASSNQTVDEKDELGNDSISMARTQLTPHKQQLDDSNGKRNLIYIQLTLTIVFKTKIKVKWQKYAIWF